MNYLFGLIVLFIKIAVMLGGLLLAASYLVWVERKLLARLQIRLGPNRAGKFGLLQPIADAIKIAGQGRYRARRGRRVRFFCWHRLWWP
jgi:NADH-quinone oxidoreductase subunit H